MTSLPLLVLIIVAQTPPAEPIAAAPVATEARTDLVATAATDFNFDPASQEQGEAGQTLTTAPADIKPAEIAYGSTGSLRWNLIGAVAANFSDTVTPQATIGLSYFIMPNLSLDPQVTVLYANQPGEDAVGGGFSLLMRWHFLPRGTWSLYFEGGAGMIFSTKDIPEGASHINFTPQIALGGTVDLGDTTRLMAGVGWYHMSNANTAIDNDGRDQVIMYMGLSFPF